MAVLLSLSTDNAFFQVYPSLTFYFTLDLEANSWN